MRPRERGETGEQDLFRARLDQIIDMDHPLVFVRIDAVQKVASISTGTIGVS